MEDFGMISVVKTENNGVIVKNNPTNYKIISRGWHGVVFKLDDQRCVKIYADKRVATREADAYKRIQGSSICPKLYEVGYNYIVMEYIEGLNLSEYLKKENCISESITKKILFLLREMKKIGFKDIDFQLCNVIVMENNILKLIDIVNGFRVKRTKKRQLFEELKEIGLLDLFIEQVKEIDYKAYLEMKNSVVKLSMEDFRMITVMKNGDGQVIVTSNPTNCKLIANGSQGAVFKLSDERCVKIYADKNEVIREADAYKRIEGSPVCPRLYEVGHNYIVMEYINGLTLRSYLKRKNYISESVTMQMLLLLREMKKLGFTVVDFGLNNVIITKGTILRLIDLANVFSIKRSNPEHLFRGLKQIGLLDLFIEQVKKIDYKTYLEMKSGLNE
ncbi:hypothetical protein IZY60_15015 [Lutibacter sp. B2]|nr:hypothetical protein [Lutibacter sp. B2]